MTSEVLVPRLSKRTATRSLRSAGTRTWIRLLVDFLDLVVVVLILLLYDSVIQKSSIYIICSGKGCGKLDDGAWAVWVGSDGNVVELEYVEAMDGWKRKSEPGAGGICSDIRTGRWFGEAGNTGT